jgi:hypothetical protein
MPTSQEIAATVGTPAWDAQAYQAALVQEEQQQRNLANQPAQISPQEDARLEQIKHDQAFHSGILRDDRDIPLSPAAAALTQQYQQSRQRNTSTWQSAEPFQATVATGGVATGRAGEYAAVWTPLTPSKYSQELANQPAMSTVPVHDISSNAPTRQELLFGYSDYEQQAINEAPLRPGFTEAANLGDTRTQMAVQGVSILRSFGMNVASEAVMMGRTLEGQRQAAFKTPGQTDDRYYSGELQKWVENKVELSSTYHHIGMKVGIPIPANRFEYQGDLAVELLKGAPRKDSEMFSPVSGEMAPYLPQFEGRGEGIQDYAWRLSEYGTRGAGEVSYSPGIEKLLSSEGQYGPYGVLWGARKEGSNPSVIEARGISVSEDYVPFKGASIRGGGVVAEVGTRIDATSPQNVEVLMAGGALPKPFTSGGVTSTPVKTGAVTLEEMMGNRAEYSGGLLGQLAFGEKAPDVIKGFVGSVIDYPLSIVGFTPMKDRMQTTDQTLTQFRSDKLAMNAKTPEEYNAFLQSSFKQGVLVSDPTTGTYIENPSLTYEYGEYSKWGVGAGNVVKNKLGFSDAQLETYRMRVEQKNGIENIPEKIVFGTGYILSTHPEKIITAYGGGAALLVGGEVIAGGYEATGVAAAAGRFALAHPTTAAIMGGAVRYGVPAALIGSTYYGASEGFTASPERTTVNIGMMVPEAGGLAYGFGSARLGMNMANRGYFGYVTGEKPSFSLRDIRTKYATEPRVKATLPVKTFDLRPTVDLSAIEPRTPARARKYEIDLGGLSTERTYTPRTIPAPTQAAPQTKPYEPFITKPGSKLGYKEPARSISISIPTESEMSALKFKSDIKTLDLREVADMNAAQLHISDAYAAGNIKTSLSLETRRLKLGSAYQETRRGTVSKMRPGSQYSGISESSKALGELTVEQAIQSPMQSTKNIGAIDLMEEQRAITRAKFAPMPRVAERASPLSVNIPLQKRGYLSQPTSRNTGIASMKPSTTTGSPTITPQMINTPAQTKKPFVQPTFAPKTRYPEKPTAVTKTPEKPFVPKFTPDITKVPEKPYVPFTEKTKTPVITTPEKPYVPFREPPPDPVFPKKPIPPEPIIPIGGGGWAPPFGGGRGSPQRGYGIRSAVATHSVGADLLGASRGSFVPMTMPRGKKGKKLGMPSFRMPRF